MPIAFTAQEISEKYDHFARWYDLVEGVLDLLGLRKLRQRLLRQVSGKVLEVAVGTGKNLLYYPRPCKITGVDVSRKMLEAARKRACRLGLEVNWLLMDAEALGFPEKTFDTVVSSLSTCTFPDPVAALHELGRVCKPNGRILLIEHGRSDREWLARWQDRRADRHARPLGCHWNREPLELVRQAGLKVSKSHRRFFGVFHQIEAEPR
jgi:ubiquinone/menaquinone biosynthesis C-methylase UbiE